MTFFRHLNLEAQQHALILGARGTGKSTFLREHFAKQSVFWIDLLLPKTEDRYARNPERLKDEFAALSSETKIIVIDEVQKVPSLLDVVHSLIETPGHDRLFILTGSSARKLRAGSANLLAGRALAYTFFPLTSFELASQFVLKDALQYGTLPKIWNLKTASAKRKTLETYALTYLNEEIRAEQAVRILDPFRRFLEVAAQSNGKIVNFSSIARDVDVDEKTVRSYYQILEDTLIGFFLEPFHNSIRKQVGKAPKFYFFDTGIVRTLSRTLTLDLLPATNPWGDAFEHFIILEMTRLIGYSGNQFRIHFIRTYEDQEIDIVVMRPGKSLLLIEIKSTENLRKDHLKHLLTLRSDFSEPTEELCLSCDNTPQMIEGVRCIPWQQGLKEYFCGPDLTDL
jgi:predicted AAA+ superfamily ATPase